MKQGLTHALVCVLAATTWVGCRVSMRNEKNPEPTTTGATIEPALSLSSVSVTNPSPTNDRNFGLNVGSTTGGYAEYCILENDTDVENCTFVAGILPTSFTVSATENYKTLSVWLKDSAGKISTRVDSGAVFLDTTAPVLTSASITNSSPTNSTIFGMSYGSVTGRSYASHCILENDTDVSNCSFVAGTLPSSFSVSATEGAKKLSVWVRDAAGNTSPRTDTGTAMLDTTAPALASATLAVNSNSFATYNITWGAIADSYAHYCILENDSDVSHCTFVKGTLPVSRTLENSAGSRTVSVWLRDAAGNTSARVESNAVTLSPTRNLMWSRSASTFGFGPVVVGRKSVPVDFRFQNFGDAAATTCGAVTLSNATDFEIVSNTCGTNPIGARQECVVMVKAIPQSAGARSASLSRTCNGTTAMQNLSTYGMSGTPVQVAVGNKANCAVLSSGQVFCWGTSSSSYGGGGSGGEWSDFPAGITTATQIAVSNGDRITGCILLADQTVKCWGNNEWGQLGDGTITSRSTPGLVPGLSGVTQVVSGDHHFCALLSDQTVRCWGYNAYGSMGDGTNSHQLSPVSPTDVSGVAKVSAGDHRVCAVLVNGQLKCWGKNLTYPPAAVAGISTAVDVAVSDSATCALLSDGSLNCWGNNVYGQVGNGSSSTQSAPGVTVLTSVASVDAGLSSFCATLMSGSVKCWGLNDRFQVGDGTAVDKSLPTLPVGLPATATAASIGPTHGCSLHTDGTIRCWGTPDSRIGDSLDKTIHRPVAVLSGATQVSVGSSSTCARMTDKTVKCWGTGGGALSFAWPGYALGTGDLLRGTAIPLSVQGVTDATQVEVGSEFACARLGDGTITCWGSNASGQLGDGTTLTRTTPVMVSGITTATDIRLGTGFGCALLADKTIKCWGRNAQGQLGDGTTNSSSSPVAVVGLTDVAQLAVGKSHSCAKLVDQRLYCWGLNTNGQLGDGTTTQRETPVEVTTLPQIAQVSTGYDYTCAALVDGTVRCFGQNGSSVFMNRLSGHTASNPPQEAHVRNVSQVLTGSGQSCVILRERSVRCGNGVAVGPTYYNSTAVLPVFGIENVESLSLSRLSYGNNGCFLDTSGVVSCFGRNDSWETGAPAAEPRLVSGLLP